MKKFLTSRGFLSAVLSVSCIAIFAVCWLVSKDTETVFQPDEPSGTVQEEWADTLSSARDSTGNYADADKSGQENEDERLSEYPKVTEESEEEVVIDFTPAETKEETAPPPPESGTGIADLEEEDSSTQPAAGSGNENGAVYDPVFGWVVPGQVNQSSITSSGDPGKMVGNMGN